MANIKISELAESNVLVGDEVLPIVQGGITKKVSVTQIVDKVDSYTKSEVDSLIPTIPEFKTINGESILGSGDLVISGGGAVDLSDYYKKTETYSKVEVDTKIADIPATDLSGYYNKTQVDSLIDAIPETDLSEYYKKTETYNKIEVDTIISNIPETDLSGYYDKAETETLLSNKIDKGVGVVGATKTKVTYNNDGIITGGADLEEADLPNISQSKITNLVSDLSNKQSRLISGTNIKTINGQSVLGSGDMVIGSSNTVIDTFAGVLSAVNAGHALVNNNNKLTNNLTNYEIATIDTNFIIGTNQAATIAGGNLSKSSNLYILHALTTGQLGTYYTSADGLTWTKRVNPFGSANITATVYVPVDTATSTYFVAAQNGGTTGYISADGVTWSYFTFSSIPNASDGNGSIFSFNGTLYIPDNSTATSFHRITTSYQGKTDYPTCGRTVVTSGVLAKTGVGVMMAKNSSGESGYTFTSDMSTFTSHTFPFEVIMNTILSNYYDFEKGAFVFISFGTSEAYTSTDLKTFTRSNINVYSVNTGKILGMQV